MIIGYSFWGFLGSGITDTPDGGRSHRRPLIDALTAAGHQVIFLQADRDRLEASDDLGGHYAFDDGFPAVDVLFLEWRWPIPGRNTTPCGTPLHTCDLHRQHELMDRYTIVRATPTVIWDKDRQLPGNSPWRNRPGVTVCEAALAPTAGARSLLFPLDDALLDAADPVALAARTRPYPLCYVGNQYDRDEAFHTYFAPAAARLPHQVAGKWRDTRRWPEVNFVGRMPFAEVGRMYGESLATVLLLPDRYAAAGQMTQRIFEAALAGCVPLAPATVTRAEEFVPNELIISDGDDAIAAVHRLHAVAGTGQHADLIAACLAKLEVFRLSRQLRTLEAILTELVVNRSGFSRSAGARS
ncbi:glycosyltransferase family protein [Streptosporangium sp. CA-135522]|uniref:glycosyltransferase family protein n=1 Tax=Streptosporangium sp. CA-135522 TaxID=3240072 RepID=UPI003D8A1241